MVPKQAVVAVVKEGMLDPEALGGWPRGTARWAER